jgi:alpha-methylacyl-CoA racemase
MCVRPRPPRQDVVQVLRYGGGALYLALGVLAAVFAVRAGGAGQVVDAAMVDGAASLVTPFFGMFAAGLLNAERGTNVLDSGAPFYDVYRCADGKYLSVAPIEGQFRKVLFQNLGIDDEHNESEQQMDWEAMRGRISARIATPTQTEWCAVFDGTDACVAPVLSIADAQLHPQNSARKTFIEIDGVVQLAPSSIRGYSVGDASSARGGQL